MSQAAERVSRSTQKASSSDATQRRMRKTIMAFHPGGVFIYSQR